jgi:hypothetical protein
MSIILTLTASKIESVFQHNMPKAAGQFSRNRTFNVELTGWRAFALVRVE